MVLDVGTPGDGIWKDRKKEVREKNIPDPVPQLVALQSLMKYPDRTRTDDRPPKQWKNPLGFHCFKVKGTFPTL